jgi:hypothetical protein
VLAREAEILHDSLEGGGGDGADEVHREGALEGIDEAPEGNLARASATKSLQARRADAHFPGTA